jgi:hypothetical protein
VVQLRVVHFHFVDGQNYLNIFFSNTVVVDVVVIVVVLFNRGRSTEEGHDRTGTGLRC